MQQIQSTVWAVNREYIAASAQDDKYRTEPTFKLQGSYRNMNKMAEKVSAIMTDEELVRLVDDHYQGESQLLTTGTEANLLKLAEIRNCMTEEQQQRWADIKSDFMRNKAMGGDDADTGAKIVVQLNDLVNSINQWQQKSQSETATEPTANPIVESGMVKAIEKLGAQLTKATAQKAPEQAPISFDSLAESLKETFLPLIRIMDGKLDLDLGTHKRMSEINDKLEMIAKQSTVVTKKKNLFGEPVEDKSKKTQPQSKNKPKDKDRD